LFGLSSAGGVATLARNAGVSAKGPETREATDRVRSCVHALLQADRQAILDQIMSTFSLEAKISLKTGPT